MDGFSAPAAAAATASRNNARALQEDDEVAEEETNSYFAVAFDSYSKVQFRERKRRGLLTIQEN